MKDYKIYIFTTQNKECEISISQVYALSFYIAWDLMVWENPNYEFIDFIAYEYTTDPINYCDESDLICLQN